MKEITKTNNSKDRLESILEYLKISANKFSKEIGHDNNVKIQHIKSGRNEISEDVALDIENRYSEFNYLWILKGKGTMLKGEEEKVSILKPSKDAPELTGYYYPNVSASAGLDISTLNQELEKVPIYLPNFGKGIDFINVYGDSMYPKYNAGEIIGIKLIEFQYLNYGYPYVVIFKNGDAYIKYVKKGKDENHVLLESENTFYEPREFNIDLIQNFYSIRGVIKKEMM